MHGNMNVKSKDNISKAKRMGVKSSLAPLRLRVYEKGLLRRMSRPRNETTGRNRKPHLKELP